MSKKTYRNKLKELIDIEDDQDVFHIIAIENGGADHKDNYDFVRGNSWNRAIKNFHDDINCYMAGKKKCQKAVAVSKELGSHTCSAKHPYHKKYSGPSAEELYRRGEALMRDLRANVRGNKESGQWRWEL